jgi:6-phosphogluconolactonase/glucosamine-6-phosphate isomerase/deaminase
VKPDVRVFPDANELSLRAAEAATATIKDAVRSTGRCSLVPSGGNTPRLLYSLLGDRRDDSHAVRRCGAERDLGHWIARA